MGSTRSADHTGCDGWHSSFTLLRDGGRMTMRRTVPPTVTVARVSLRSWRLLGANRRHYEDSADEARGGHVYRTRSVGGALTFRRVVCLPLGPLRPQTRQNETGPWRGGALFITDPESADGAPHVVHACRSAIFCSAV